MSADRRRLIIFDWNGTLQDDTAVYYEYSFRRVFIRFGLPPPSFEECQRDVSAADYLGFFHRRGIPSTVTTNDIFESSRAEIRADGVMIDLFPEVPHVIGELCRMGSVLTIVSMAPREQIVEALSRHELVQCFDEIAGRIHVKHEVFRAHCAASGVPPESAIAVGDLIDDAVAAHAVGMRSLICPRGFHARDRVEVARTEIPTLTIIETLRDVLAHVAS